MFGRWEKFLEGRVLELPAVNTFLVITILLSNEIIKKK